MQSRNRWMQIRPSFDLVFLCQINESGQKWSHEVNEWSIIVSIFKIG